MDRKAWVYKITSPSGKAYIGITVKKLVRRRWSEHKTYDSPVGRAIRKHKDRIKYEVLCLCDSWREACVSERFYISMFNTRAPYGYNLTDGGEGTPGRIVNPHNNNLSYRIFTDDDKRRASELYKSGMKIIDVAKEIGFGKTATRKHIIDSGADIRKGGTLHAHIPDSEIVAMYNGGSSSLKVAKRFGMSKATVLIKLKANGVIMRPTGSYKKTGQHNE